MKVTEDPEHTAFEGLAEIVTEGVTEVVTDTGPMVHEGLPVQLLAWMGVIVSEYDPPPVPATTLFVAPVAVVPPPVNESTTR